METSVVEEDVNGYWAPASLQKSNLNNQQWVPNHEVV
jgi:hypothetical protein